MYLCSVIVDVRQSGRVSNGYRVYAAYRHIDYSTEVAQGQPSALFQIAFSELLNK